MNTSDNNTIPDATQGYWSALWPPTQEESLQAILGAALEIHEARQRIHQLQRITSLILTRHTYTWGIDYELVHKLYWYHEDDLPITVVASALGIPPSAVSELAGPCNVVLECGRCAKEFSVRAGTRDEVLTPEDHPLCPDCASEHKRKMQETREQWDPNLDASTSPASQEYTTQQLRSMSYDEYLMTDHWLALRQRALEKAGHRCQVCNNVGTLHVHHRSYARRGNEALEDLTVLCPSCHRLFHSYGKLVTY